jgi:anaerobic ribonucleoside-triphosphate reductase activating protein
MTSLLLSRLHYPVRNLGFGVRAGIWFQGCSIFCHGCVSRDTWPFDESRRCDIEAVMAWLDTLDGPVDGITISGGEPTDQPEALRALLDTLSVRRRTADILMYSGRSTEQLKSDFPWLWDSVDVLISEPYDYTQADDCALRGSANQRVHRLSPLAQQRYPDDAFESTYAPQREQISINVDDHRVWMVGIPKPGDLARLRRSLADRGITMGKTSWLS